MMFFGLQYNFYLFFKMCRGFNQLTCAATLLLTVF